MRERWYIPFCLSGKFLVISHVLMTPERLRVAKDVLLGAPLAENLRHVAEEVVFSESVL